MLSNLNSWTLKLLTKVAQTNINGAVVGNKYTFRARVSIYCTAAGWSMCSSCASRVLPLQLSHRVRHQFFWLINTLRSLKIPEGHLTRFTAVLKLFPESLKTLLTIWMKKKKIQPVSQVATVFPIQVCPTLFVKHKKYFSPCSRQIEQGGYIFSWLPSLYRLGKKEAKCF